MLTVYGVIAALHDPRGSLGTDTGGKLATVEMMRDRGTLDPDIGYWAQRQDPEGDLHPLYYTSKIDDRWVNVTTLPMVVAAQPLAEIGGLRAAMLLPMLGGLLCAFAASALAVRLDERARWHVFWIIGLATPVAVYATDFWEHSLGLGLLLAGSVACFDVALRRKGWWTAAGAGMCFGAAATMRTEALVYVTVSLFVVCAVVFVEQRGWRPAAIAGAGIMSGVVATLVGNVLLEQAILGRGLRTARAAGTAAAAGSTIAIRVKEALIYTFGFNSFRIDVDVMAGIVAAACVVAGAMLIMRRSITARFSGYMAFFVAGVLYLERFAQGLGFLPGLLIASPFAAVGIALGWGSRPQRFVLALALLPLPLVWASQYSGGAHPQWGARYELLSGALLAVVGIVVLRRDARALVGVITLAAVVTGFGLVFSVERSHDVARAMEVVVRSGAPVISREDHVLREGGAFYTPTAHWLTAENASELRRAVSIVATTGAPKFEVLQFHGRAKTPAFDGYRATEMSSVEFVPGVLLDVITYAHS
ncbi:MAG: hypothetical protein ABW073_06245 [Acidimicrobiia bacterium]